MSTSRVDAFVHSAAVDHKHIPITYHIPGWVATLALVVMNITSRQELAEPEEMYVDDNFTVGFHVCHCKKFTAESCCAANHCGLQSRAKILLFISYLMAFGAVAGSVAVLITCVQHHVLVDIGVVSTVLSFLTTGCAYYVDCNYNLSVCREPCCNVALSFSVDCCYGLSGQQTLQGTSLGGLAIRVSHAKGCGLCFLYVNLYIMSQQADLSGSTINQTWQLL